MHINSNNTRNRTLRLVTLALFGALALPSIGSATPPATVDEPTLIAAGDGDGDDPDCDESVIALEIDVTTGEVFLVDATGARTLTDNDINIYMEAIGNVLLDIQYTSGDWEVEITPEGGTPDYALTRGSWLRYSIDDSVDSYVFSSTEVVSGAMNMTPVVPDIILRPKKNCPPPT